MTPNSISLVDGGLSHVACHGEMRLLKIIERVDVWSYACNYPL